MIGEYELIFDDSRTSGGTLSGGHHTCRAAPMIVTGTIIVNVAGGPIEINIGVTGESDWPVPNCPTVLRRSTFPRTDRPSAT